MYHALGGARDLGMLQDSNENRRISSLFPRHPKINRIPTPATNCFLQIFSQQMLALQTPHNDIQTNKSLNNQKKTGMQNNTNFASKLWKLQKWSPRIYLKSLKIRLWTPRCPFLGLPGWPSVAKMFPRAAKCSHQACQMSASGIQKWLHSLRKSCFKRVACKLTSRNQLASTRKALRKAKPNRSEMDEA